MMNQDDYDFPKTGIHYYVAKYISALPDLSGKVVLDIPCGEGRASYEFIKKGAEVIALDLFPSFMKVEEVKAKYADLTEVLPIESESVDYVICQEGIEHIQNQLKAFEEFNRVLKPGGILLMSTPNYSHFRARLSRFFLESDLWRRMPPTEIDSVWFAEKNSEKLYFGHMFLVGVHHLKSLATFSGFKVTRRIKTKIGNTSFLLGVILYPLFVFVTVLAFLLYRKKNTHVEEKKRKSILWDRVKLNLSFKTLFCKDTFWEFQKVSNAVEVITKLKEMHRT